MSEWIPCPACGSESSPEAAACNVCGYRLDVETRDSGKCARCGSGLGTGFEFCQICGLRVQSRRRRPVTQSLRLIQRPRGEPAAMTPVSTPMPGFVRPTAEVAVATPVSPGVSPVVSPAVSPVVEAGDEVEPPTGVYSVGPEAKGVEAGAEPATAVYSGPAVGAEPKTVVEPGSPVASGPPEPAPAPAAEWSPPSQSRPSVVAAVSGPAPAQRRAPGASKLRLVLVQRDGSEGEVIPMGDASLTIGRWQGDLCFPADEFLGAVHARVDPHPDGVLVADLATRNGIYVRISRPEAVFPGDLFLLGHHLLRLENIPPAGREQDPGPDGVRGFGTPLQPAWARLVLLGPGGAEAETHYLRHPQVVFGRELGDIVFPADPFVSWQHAQLSMEVAGEAMGVTLTDLRSANGTYLRARGDVILSPGDMFRVGDQIFRVRMH